jgi:UDP-N-acetylmuramoyl-tripeptide--D-alanyl-D-alanine ligase
MRLRVAGFGEAADVRPEGGEGGIEVLPGGATRWSFRGARVDLPLPGMHNVRNALIALGVSTEFGVPVEDSAKSIAAMAAPKMRNEWRRVGSLNVLADCYNANPPSTRAAIDLLASLPGDVAKIAVLGTMRELGDHAADLHRSVLQAALSRLGSGIDRLVVTGDFVAALDDGAGDGKVIAVEDPLEAYASLRPLLKGDETILLKGSRGVALERIIPLLENDFAGTDPRDDATHTAHAGA